MFVYVYRKILIYSAFKRKTNKVIKRVMINYTKTIYIYILNI